MNIFDEFGKVIDSILKTVTQLTKEGYAHYAIGLLILFGIFLLFFS